MLTEAQAIAVAEFLVAHTPGANGELEHSHISAWRLACEALAALDTQGKRPLVPGSWRRLVFLRAFPGGTTPAALSSRSRSRREG